MEMRRGNLTVGALMGTGAATLGLALFGLAGLGGDLRAADAMHNTPVTTQELRDSVQQERTSPKWDGRSPLASPPLTETPTAKRTPQPTPTPTPTAEPQQEL